MKTEELRLLQQERLRELLRVVGTSNRFWQSKWQAAGVDVANAELAQLPLTTKAELVEDHKAHPPYGSNLTFAVGAYSRFCQTSGTTGQPLRWLDTPESWQWMLGCWEQIFELAGLRADDRLAFPFSFGPFLGFWAAFEGAARLGRLCLPGGGMSSEARLKFIEENQATVVCCTPTYALRLGEVAAELAKQPGNSTASEMLKSVRLLIVAGEPGGSVTSIRHKIEESWGARVIDHWGMTEVGPLAGECVENPGGLHVLETECIAEILDTVTGQPFDLKDTTAPVRGELVITNLGRVGSPMIRYRTGDIVELDPQPCPCGRPLMRLKGGILGRVDDMLTIRGNNVFPTAIEAILREFSEVIEFQFETVTRDSMPQLQIDVETTFGLPNSESETEQFTLLVERIAAAIHDRLHFRPEIVAVPPQSLPRSELKSRRMRRRKGTES
ncbi:MAG: phenylacetate--CoA ligase family protein [Planctomycetota bacterium]|nr:MAG: phenylacetate--CoA ligase family protein [Planctomycetota bacterium]